MKKYAVMRMRKIKNTGNLVGLIKHNERIFNTINADANKLFENEKMFEDFNIEDYSRDAEELRTRKDNVIGIELVLTASHGFDAKIDLEEWKKANILWLKSEFGEKNLRQMWFHKDEDTPHIHALILPEKDKKLNANYFFGNKKNMSERQDRYAIAMSPFELERGKKKAEMSEKERKKAYHVPAHDLQKRREKLYKDISFLERKQEEIDAKIRKTIENGRQIRDRQLQKEREIEEQLESLRKREEALSLEEKKKEILEKCISTQYWEDKEGALNSFVTLGKDFDFAKQNNIFSEPVFLNVKEKNRKILIKENELEKRESALGGQEKEIDGKIAAKEREFSELSKKVEDKKNNLNSNQWSTISNYSINQSIYPPTQQKKEVQKEVQKEEVKRTLRI